MKYFLCTKKSNTASMRYAFITAWLLLIACIGQAEAPHVQVRVLAPGWIAIDWEHPADGAEAIIIERESPAKTWSMFNLTNSYTDIGLQANTVYRYRVSARYGNRLDWTSWIAVRTMPAAGNNGPLPVPVFTSTSSTPGSINIQWTSSVPYGFYQVRWAKEGDPDEQHKINGNVYTLNGLQPGRYHFIIQGCNKTLLGSSCSNFSAPLFVNTTTTPPPPPKVVVKGIIYGLNLNDELVWYQHAGREDGSFRWAFTEAKIVGRGWDFKKVFTGGDGIIYAIAYNGDLLWYRHTGWESGTFNWAFNEGKKVGVGWGSFKQLFAGENGIIYGLKENGDLVWFRHTGNQDGSFRWQFSEEKVVGKGWGNFRKLFYGGDGIIYAISNNGDLLWYRHTGYQDGSFRWAFSEAKKVGIGWNGAQQVCYGGDGIIYAAMDNGELMWYRHTGREDGSFRWAFNQGRKVGIGWYKFTLKQIFCK